MGTTVEEIRVGDRVRAFDYDCRDLEGGNACFTEGLVVDIVNDGPVFEGRYVIQVERDVWTGKDMDVRVGTKIFPPVNGRTIQPAGVYMNRVVRLHS